MLIAAYCFYFTFSQKKRINIGIRCLGFLVLFFYINNMDSIFYPRNICRRMIFEFAIREWNETVPWTDSEQVEQDLLICRALTEIYKDEYLASHLAFRGGTALHKLHLSPQPRYSEDIDLVQVTAEPI